jgi:hypothetical protein
MKLLTNENRARPNLWQAVKLTAIVSFILCISAVKKKDSKPRGRFEIFPQQQE